MKSTLISIIAATFVMAAGSQLAWAEEGANGHVPYEVWGADQSNSTADQTSPGTNGSFLWIWDSRAIERQIAGGRAAKPIGCSKRRMSNGPCDLLEVFPGRLREFDADGPTGARLRDLPAFGRLHGMLPDPQNMYMNANIFAPGGGYVGIIDGRTKGAVALFRVTGTTAGRSLHMSFWNSDGTALLLANLNGKVLERIDVIRDRRGRIRDVKFNQSASLGVGKAMSITASAKAYRGRNAHGRRMLGRVIGQYDPMAFDDLTPNGRCKENGCDGPDGANGGRPNNVIICPIVSDSDKAYITVGGGGLLIANTRATPMTIVGEYGNQDINAAGCGGVQVGTKMWLNAGVSAAAMGATWSTFTMYTLNDTEFSAQPNAENTPAPRVVYRDPTNTATGGNFGGPAENTSGQLPGLTTRRDAHGAARTTNGSHVHNVDRIQNNVEVFDTATGERTTYDLTSYNGRGGGTGPCAAASVTDDPMLPLNDPAPDLIEQGPNGRYMFVALRGPVPVSVTHSAQGSCPGVGIIEILDNGRSGRLAAVLRTVNTIDTAAGSAPGGHAYTGVEHSDVHGASVRIKVEKLRKQRRH